MMYCSRSPWVTCQVKLFIIHLAAFVSSLSSTNPPRTSCPPRVCVSQINRQVSRWLSYLQLRSIGPGSPSLNLTNALVIGIYAPVVDVQFLVKAVFFVYPSIRVSRLRHCKSGVHEFCISISMTFLEFTVILVVYY